MAQNIQAASIVRDVAALMKTNRRAAAAIAASQVPVPAKDRLVITTNGQPATWQLSALPYTSDLGSSLNLSLNGLELDEATDYSVNYATGLVTFSTAQQAAFAATPTPADVLMADYWTTDELIANAQPVDLGPFIDTFNRADSSTTLGTTSDGRATWATTSTNNVPWGITSNTAKMFGGLGEDAQAYIDCGTADGILQATLATLDNNVGIRNAGSMFRWSDHINYWFVQCKDVAGVSQLVKKVANSKILVGSTFTTTVGDTVTVTLSGGSVSVAVNGTTVSAVSDSFNQTATKHGMYSETQVSHFDNWSFSPS